MKSREVSDANKTREPMYFILFHFISSVYNISSLSLYIYIYHFVVVNHCFMFKEWCSQPQNGALDPPVEIMICCWVESVWDPTGTRKNRGWCHLHSCAFDIPFWLVSWDALVAYSPGKSNPGIWTPPVALRPALWARPRSVQVALSMAHEPAHCTSSEAPDGLLPAWFSHVGKDSKYANPPGCMANLMANLW